MLIKVVQRFPNSTTGMIAQEAECTNVEDIESIPFIQRWVNDKVFWRLCKCTQKGEQHHLICETNKGEGFYVIAYLYGDIEQLDLPEWKQ